MSEGKRVFISYAHKDGVHLARHLRADLLDRGFDVWLDESRLDGGSSWSNEIEQAINRSDVVLALLSAGSFESNVCRGEHLRSLRLNKWVLPLLVQGNADRPVYLEASHFRDFSDAGQYALRFNDVLDDIEHGRTASLAEKYRRAQYDTRPPLLPNFVPRPHELNLLRQAVISDVDQQRVALVALGGMGGIGKTCLAQSLCFDQAVLDAFPDGVVWVRIGETPLDADIVAQMKEAARALGEAATGFDSREQGARLLRSLLRDKAALLVLDDVWNARHAYDFTPNDARFCRILLTTRETEIAAGLGAQVCPLDVMSGQLSRQLLAEYAGKSEPLPAAADGIVQKCHGLPLALAMIGAEVNGQPDEYWADIANDFAARLLSLQRDLPLYGHPGVVAAMDVSLMRLDAGTREAYLQLAVLPEDTEIPEAALATVWGQTAAGMRATVAALTRKSLARRGGADLLVLHDVQLAHLRASAAETLSARHLSLLERYRRRCFNGWHSGPNDGYFFERLAYHLRHAGRADELRDLLFDHRWLEKKLAATGVPALVDDFDVALASTKTEPAQWGAPIGVSLWRRVEAANETAGQPAGAQAADSAEPLWLLQGAIRLSSHVIGRDPGQFSSQLVGRLLPHQGVTAIAAFLKQLAADTLGCWLRPQQPALYPPGAYLVRTLEGHTLAVIGVALSGDGRRAVSASEDQTLKVWDVATGRELRSLHHNFPITGVALSEDGRRAISASTDKTLKVWDVETGRALCTLEEWTEALGVALSGDGGRAVSASRDEPLTVWDVETGRVLRTLQGHTGSVRCVALSGDGRRAVSASSHHTVKVWDVETGRELRTFEGHTGRVFGVALSGDGGRAVSASEDQTLKVWDVETGRELHTLPGHTDLVWSVALSRDGRRAVSASDDHTLKVWDVETGRELRTLRGHDSPVTAVALSGDGRHAASASEDHTLKVWDVEAEREPRTVPGHTDSVWSVALSRDGRRAVSASDDHTLKVWDVETGRDLRTLLGHTDGVRGVVLSGDGQRAVSASRDKTLKVWDIETGRELRTLRGHDSPVTAVALSADGRRAVSASDDCTLKVWDVETGRELRTLQGHSTACVALSGDGRRAVSASYKTLKVWDLAGGREFRTLRGHDSPVTAVALSEDGRRAISASFDQHILMGSSHQTLKVWDVATGRELRTFEGHTGQVFGVALSRDGRRSVSASMDKTLKVWDVETSVAIATFTCDSAACCCAFTDDRVAAGDAGGHVHFLCLEEPNSAGGLLRRRE